MINLLFLVPLLVYSSSGTGSSKCIRVSNDQILNERFSRILEIYIYFSLKTLSRTDDFTAYDIIVCTRLCSGDHFES